MNQFLKSLATLEFLILSELLDAEFSLQSYCSERLSDFIYPGQSVFYPLNKVQ